MTKFHTRNCFLDKENEWKATESTEHFSLYVIPDANFRQRVSIICNIIIVLFVRNDIIDICSRN